MAKLLFDKYKPFASVSPPYNGAVNHQKADDGKYYYFNGNGFPIDIETGEVLNVTSKPKAPEIVVSEVVTVNENGEKTFETVEKVVAPEADARVELKKWLMDAEDAEKNWMKVRSYGSKVFGKVAASKDNLIGFAIDANFIKESEVRIS